MLLAGLLVATAGAAPSATYADPAGDGNETPDISSVTVDDSSPGAVNVRVQVANFDELPSDSRIILEFDLDRNANTGVAGDEIVVRYWDDELFEVLRWDGIRLSPGSTEGMTASFASGTFSFSADRAALANTSSFGLIALSARNQQLDIGRVVGTDYAPPTGRSIYSFSGPASFPDPTHDHDAAPDITSISVSDTPGGKIDVRVATSNYPTLPADKVIGVDFDLEDRPPAADDVFVEYLSGPGIVQVNIEENEVLAPSIRPNTATGRYENGVLTLSVDRKELDGAAIVGVGVVTFDVVGRGESEGQAFEGDVEAVDSAPDDLTGALFPYRLANRPRCSYEPRRSWARRLVREREGASPTVSSSDAWTPTRSAERLGDVLGSRVGDAGAGGGSVCARTRGVQPARAGQGDFHASRNRHGSGRRRGRPVDLQRGGSLTFEVG